MENYEESQQSIWYNTPHSETGWLFLCDSMGDIRSFSVNHNLSQPISLKCTSFIESGPWVAFDINSAPQYIYLKALCPLFDYLSFDYLVKVVSARFLYYKSIISPIFRWMVFIFVGTQLKVWVSIDDLHMNQLSHWSWQKFNILKDFLSEIKITLNLPFFFSKLILILTLVDELKWKKPNIWFTRLRVFSKQLCIGYYWCMCINVISITCMILSKLQKNAHHEFGIHMRSRTEKGKTYCPIKSSPVLNHWMGAN